jgi:transcription elongation factor Elf1
MKSMDDLRNEIGKKEFECPKCKAPMMDKGGNATIKYQCAVCGMKIRVTTQHNDDVRTTMTVGVVAGYMLILAVGMAVIASNALSRLIH